MPLSDRSRTTIYQAFEPIVGQPAIEELLSNFPAREVDAPATQAFVHAEFAARDIAFASFRQETRDDMTSFQQEMRDDMASFRQEMRDDMASFRQEIRDDMAELRLEFAELRLEFAELKVEVQRMFASQTRWMVGMFLTLIAVQVALAALLH